MYSTAYKWTLIVPPPKMVIKSSDNWTAEIKGKEMLSSNKVLLQTQ